MKAKNWILSLAWSSILLLLVVFLAFVDKRQFSEECKQVEVDIVDEKEVGFITDADVIAEMTDFEGGILGRPLDDINMQLFENKLNTNHHINNAEVYSTIDGVVHVKLRQRQPIIRVICSDGSQFYLDEQGVKIPVSENFSAPVLTANGFITDDTSKEGTVREGLGASQSVREVFRFGKWLAKNSFWSDMIQQVYVEQNGDLILITRIGDHKITLGNTENLDEKFEKLMAFYKGGLNRTGWNLYSDINLKFEDQVVCSKTRN